MVAEAEREYITVEEAASRAGLSEATLRRVIAKGFLHYRGRRRRTLLLDGNELAAGLAAYHAAKQEIQPFDEDK